MKKHFQSPHHISAEPEWVKRDDQWMRAEDADHQDFAEAYYRQQYESELAQERFERKYWCDPVREERERKDAETLEMLREIVKQYGAPNPQSLKTIESLPEPYATNERNALKLPFNLSQALRLSPSAVAAWVGPQAIALYWTARDIVLVIHEPPDIESDPVTAALYLAVRQKLEEKERQDLRRQKERDRSALRSYPSGWED